jgi:putative ABC transport system ATP-binding protein
MISIKGITKYFHRGSINEVLALENINLDVKRGDFITIIGSNGAGKSTLLNCLAGCFPPDEGTVFMDEMDVTSWPEHRRAHFLSRVFQNPLLGTCASLTIEQNLALAARRDQRHGLGLGVKRADRELFRDKLRHLKLDLEDRLKDRVGLLSGGQRQALTMLMATMVRPQVLLLDEHTAALDPKIAHQILDLTEMIVQEQHLTALMVTHNMKQALRMGNRLVMMHRAEIILDIKGQEKDDLKVEDLIERFYTIKGEEFSRDRMLLV